MDAAGTAVMPPPKKTTKPKAKMGRPKAPKPLRSLTVFRGTDDLGAWVDVVMRASESKNRAHLLYRALKAFAPTVGVKEAPPER